MKQFNTSEMARGRWSSILTSLGVSSKLLTGDHGPCPGCGGKDRFRFDNQEGRGTYFCNACGAGDGIDLACMHLGVDKREAMRRIDALLGTAIFSADVVKEASPEQKVQWARRVWASSVPVSQGDPVDLYLRSRGVGEPAAAYPATIRFAPSCRYEGAVSHPAMVSLITGPDRALVGVHRTYLTPDGRKIDGTARKVLGTLPDGSAVRTCAPQEALGIAEGIETALSASALYGLPVWAAISSGGLERWSPPAECKEVVIFGDSDESFAGQAAAYALAKRLRVKGIAVSVTLPSGWGDFNDEQMMRRRPR